MERQSSISWQQKASWAVAVFFENDRTRSEAVNYCDGLVEKFWSKSGFDFGWWRFSDLNDFPTARQASQGLIRADLIVVSAEPADDLPRRITVWMEHCLHKRGAREGAMVGLLDPTSRPGCPISPKYTGLRRMAHHAGLDYITELPQTIAEALPDSLDQYHRRADQVSGVLNQILSRPNRPLGVL